MKQIGVDEWLAKGAVLFGENKDDWLFRCVACNHVQSATEARERKPEIDQGKDAGWLRNHLAMNCEGRLNKDVGCDWTLGGLFHIHKLEVIDGDDIVPVFEFAEK